jgi:hypothetical protein
VVQWSVDVKTSEDSLILDVGLWLRQGLTKVQAGLGALD